MPNKNYLRGRRFEYEVAKAMRDDGYTVMRTAGSHGPFDVIGLDPDKGLIAFVQCKVVATEAAKAKLVKDFEGEQEPNDPRFFAKISSRYGLGVIEALAVKVAKR